MPQSLMRLIKRSTEFRPQSSVKELAWGLRGVYVLYRFRKNRKEPKQSKYNVVYIGMSSSTTGIRGRLDLHVKKKAGLWTHFSAFEVWDNIRDDEIVELEGLFRHIYRKDAKANELNKQGGYLALKKVKNNNLSTWGEG